MTIPAIELTNIRKHYPGTVAVNDVSLCVQQGEIMVLLGPSGCGKTTTLRLIAGLERPDSGEVLLNGQTVAGRGKWKEPEARKVGLVFQDYALFPHLSVTANVVFGLRGWPRKKQIDRAEQLLTLVGLPGLGERMPHELSGGQQQRVALARALAPEPDVMLLDEPFSNLDAALRAQVRSEVRDILRETGVTTVFVTHDQEEALSLSDQIAVMFDGRIAQIGAPQAVYAQPNSRTVAAFVGEANFLPAQGNGAEAKCALGTVPVTAPAEGPVLLLVRPESISLSANGSGVQATVRQVEFFGHDQRIHLKLESGTLLMARADAYSIFAPGQKVGVSLLHPAQAFAL